jgi:uncharacterized membrane protein YdfJ with MMPL/SSD domain
VGAYLYRLGRLSARHRFVVLLVWIALAIMAIGLVKGFGGKTNNSLDLPGTDSQAAFDLLTDKFPPQQNGTNPFVFHVDQGVLTDPEPKAAITATYKAIKQTREVDSVTNPVTSKAAKAGLLSDDGRTAFMPVLLNVDSGFITEQLAEKVLEATAPARKAGIEVAVGGSIGGVLSTPETKESEIIGNIAAMVILALVFGSLVAMGTPIVTAIIALSIGLSLIGMLGHAIAIPSVAPTLATMIGLGVGIDYALFLVTKHLEQLQEGVEVKESIARAVASSGSAIVFAGGTVVIALVSLAVAGIPLVSSLGYASAVSVLFAVLASISLLPAILSLLGGSVRRLHIPAFLTPKPRSPGERRWDAWARGVSRHPWIAVVISLAILIPLIVPLFQLTLGQEDIGVSPKDTTERRAYDLLTAGFGVGYNGPLLIASTLDPVAEPSAGYTKKYDKATALQKKLEKEKRRLQAQADALKAEQASLERQQAQLERRGAALRARKAELERQEASLRAQEARLRTQAQRLVRQAAPIVAHLAFILARERFVQRQIDMTTNPDRLRRLRARLARLEQREANTRSRLAPLKARAESLFAQAESLLSRAEQLDAQATTLQAQADALQAQAAQLQREGNQLKAEADELKQQQAEAQAQKQVALRLKKELTAMLTKAGGDPRGTDPRIVALQDAISETSGVVGMFPPQINDDGDAATLSAIPERAPSSEATAELVAEMRDNVLPSTNRESGVTSYVGGSTASNVDLAAKISQRLPIVIFTVLALSFLLLMVAFRSLLVPVQAAVTNLLSVAAALGVLTAVFQWGWGLSLIGLDAPRGTVPIASYVPLMMFAVLFGLSMDYEVFLVSRIQQHHAEGEEPTQAVVSGVGSGAHVVTAAALIMFFVFASFVLNGDPTVKQFGVGLAVAVALAGTLVVLLAPALLTLFGKGVFWVPRFLDRVLPHLDIEGKVSESKGSETSASDPDQPSSGRGPTTGTE